MTITLKQQNAFEKEQQCLCFPLVVQTFHLRGNKTEQELFLPATVNV